PKRSEDRRRQIAAGKPTTEGMRSQRISSLVTICPKGEAQRTQTAKTLRLQYIRAIRGSYFLRSFTTTPASSLICAICVIWATCGNFTTPPREHLATTAKTPGIHGSPHQNSRPQQSCAFENRIPVAAAPSPNQP